VRPSKPLLVLVFSALLTAGAASAQSASELFAEGNALARSGVYRTALVRYREAVAAGLDTPLLHFNVAVVNYLLGEFDTAAQEFGAAAADPALSALALFNQGLAARAAGDATGATAAFARAAERADDRDLRRLADTERTAAATPPTVGGGRPVERTPVRGTPAADESTGRGGLELSAAARLGTDDNVYRTPAEPYVDLSVPGQPLVTPEPRSASFMPVELAAAYVLGNESGDTAFRVGYDLDGDFYDTEFANASRVDQRVSMGAAIVLGERERRRRTVETSFYARTHRQANFDPDDGLDRDITVLVNGLPVVEDIGDRFSYKASGVEGVFGHEVGRWTWGFDMRFERREYERTELVANFDQEYFYTGVDIDYSLGSATTLRFGLVRYRLLYDDRPARDLAGALLTTNPAQYYDYAGAQLGLTRALGSAISLELDYSRVERTDRFVGYYDYSRDALRVRARFKPMDRFDMAIGVVARSYDYPRAFAFHAAAAGARELKEMGAELTAEYRATRRLALFAAIDTLDVTSTDLRAEHSRVRTTFGVEWRR
jgi:hypothetical protein